MGSAWGEHIGGDGPRADLGGTAGARKEGGNLVVTGGVVAGIENIGVQARCAIDASDT